MFLFFCILMGLALSAEKSKQKTSMLGRQLSAHTFKAHSDGQFCCNYARCLAKKSSTSLCTFLTINSTSSFVTL